MTWKWKMGLYVFIFGSLFCTLLTAFALWHRVSAEERGQQQAIVINVQSENEAAKWMMRSTGHPTEPIQILIASDGNRLAGMMATINSIVSNTEYPLFFYLVTSKDSIHYLIKWIENSKLRGLSYAVHVYPQNLLKGFAKLEILKMFPEMRGTLIYMDDDCIVQGDIKELADSSFKPGQFEIHVSSDCSSVSKQFGQLKNTYSAYINFNNPQIKNLKMKAGTCSVDTGVFVTNATEWFHHNVTEKLEYWINLNKNNSVFRTQTKDATVVNAAMMLVFYSRITIMNPMWHVRHLGVTSGSRYSEHFLRQAKLLHWDGVFKPWVRQSSHTNLWDRYFIPDPTKRFRLIRKRKPFTADNLKAQVL